MSSKEKVLAIRPGAHIEVGRWSNTGMYRVRDDKGIVGNGAWNKVEENAWYWAYKYLTK